MSDDRLPKTDSIQELARFWDEHDLSDFEDALEEVADSVFRRETVVRLNLPSDEADAVERLAASKGIDPADLIREWVSERVRAAS